MDHTVIMYIIFVLGMINCLRIHVSCFVSFQPKGREMRDDTSLVIDMSKNTSPKVYFNMSNFFKTPGYVPDSLRMYLYTTGMSFSLDFMNYSVL
jgi:hypothetical protein